MCVAVGSAVTRVAVVTCEGVDVDPEVVRWGPPVPPMFNLRDPNGNTLMIVEPLD